MGYADAQPVRQALTPNGRGYAPTVNPRLQLSLQQWLQGMDDSGFLLQYHEQIASSFDSLEQIHKSYVQNGEINASFFADVGIKKLGHRRIFEKWFRDSHKCTLRPAT